MVRPHRILLLIASRAGQLGRRWRERGRDLLVSTAPVAGALLMLWGAVFLALDTYAEHKSNLRLAETNRYIEQFEDEPVAGAWRRLALAWRAERPRQDALLTAIADREADAIGSMARQYREFVLESIARRDLVEEIDTVLQFYKRLALCIRMQSCDAGIAARRFGDDAWRFRNQHYPYLVERYPEEDIDAIFRVIAPRPAASDLNDAA